MLLRRHRYLSSASSPGPLDLFHLRTPDVDAATGLCAAGLVRIARCPTDKKGFGAFAAQPIETGRELGVYAGEVISLAGLLERYGDAGGVDSPDEWESANRQAMWVAERMSRGVGVSGMYVFSAGEDPSTGRDVLIDGEDPVHANWTRFINHSGRRSNLSVTREVVPAENDDDGGGSGRKMGKPFVRFIAQQPIADGEELLFDYADGFDLQDVLDFEVE